MLDFTKEIEGLTVAAIDWVTEGIQAQGGKSTYWWTGPDGKCRCALGSIGYEGCTGIGGWKHEVRAMAMRVGLAQRYLDNHIMSDVASLVSSANSLILVGRELDESPISNAERGQRMLAWLQMQRDFKCSSWTPPVKEVVPVRNREVLQYVGRGDG